MEKANKQRIAAVSPPPQAGASIRRIDPEHDSSVQGFDIERSEMPYLLNQLHEASKIKRRAEHGNNGTPRQEL